MTHRASIALALTAGAAGVAAGLGAVTLIDGRRPLRPAAPTRRPAAPARPAAPPARLPEVQKVLQRWAAGRRGKVALHVRVDGKGQAGIRAGEPMPAASIIKLPIMGALQDAWRTGFLQRTGVDEGRLRRMITRSENAPADFLIDRVGTSQINAWLAGNGCTRTRLRHKLLVPPVEPGENEVTAREMTHLLLKLARGELVGPAASSEMRRLLLAQTRRTRIPAGLPGSAVCGNKTGTLRGIVNDVAFVEPPGGPRYGIAVLISGAGSEPATSTAIARLSTEVYAVVSRNPDR